MLKINFLKTRKRPSGLLPAAFFLDVFISSEGQDRMNLALSPLHSLGDRLENRLSDLLELYIQAYYAPRRRKKSPAVPGQRLPRNPTLFFPPGVRTGALQLYRVPSLCRTPARNRAHDRRLAEKFGDLVGDTPKINFFFRFAPKTNYTCKG